MNRFYLFVRTLVYPLVRLLWPFRTYGVENLPTDRPFILCPNHCSPLDPVLVLFAMPRRIPIRIMAKKELLKIPLLGPFLRAVGVFGVDRGNSDIAALRTAIKTIRSGQNLLVFPEGMRVKHPGQARAKGGVSLIALRTNAVLVPVYAGKRKKFLHRTDVIFGKPYEPKTEAHRGTAEEYQAFADEVLRRAYELGGEQLT